MRSFLTAFLFLFCTGPALASAPQTYDVIVVGAGAAGLHTAGILKARGLNVLCLEARDRVGGRVFSQPIGDGQYVELGAQWMAFEGQHRLQRLVAESGIHPQTHSQLGKDLALSRGGTRTLKPGALDMSVLAQLDTLQVYLRLNRILRRVSVAEPWRSADLDRVSAADWVQGAAWTKESRDFWTHVINQETCCDSRTLSMLELAQNMATAGEVERLDRAEHYYFPQGLGALFRKMAADLGDSLKTGQRVLAVSENESRVTVTTDGNSYVARYVVLALPPQLMGELGIPSHLAGVADRMLEGRAVKMIAVYDSPWWRDKGFSGRVTSRDGQLDLVVDSSHEGAGKGILVGLVSGPRSQAIGERSLADKQEIFKKHIHAAFGEWREPLQFYSHDWTGDVFTRGGYASHRPLGEWTKSQDALISPSGHLLFAGTETAREWRGFIEGALESAERAAAECESLLR